MAVALITGGSAGLGRALAHALADDGWRVVVDGRDADRLFDATESPGLVGIPGERGLEYAGRVGSGFREVELDRLLKRLGELEQSAPPFLDVPAIDAKDAVWVRPELVGEIEFGEWTRTGVARHPRWRGLRPDKSPDEVVRET